MPVVPTRPTAITGVVVLLTNHLLLSFPSERNVHRNYTEASPQTCEEK